MIGLAINTNDFRTYIPKVIEMGKKISDTSNIEYASLDKFDGTASIATESGKIIYIELDERDLESIVINLGTKIDECGDECDYTDFIKISLNDANIELNNRELNIIDLEALYNIKIDLVIKTVTGETLLSKHTVEYYNHMLKTKDLSSLSLEIYKRYNSKTYKLLELTYGKVEGTIYKKVIAKADTNSNIWNILNSI